MDTFYAYKLPNILYIAFFSQCLRQLLFSKFTYVLTLSHLLIQMYSHKVNDFFSFSTALVSLTFVFMPFLFSNISNKFLKFLPQWRSVLEVCSSQTVKYINDNISLWYTQHFIYSQADRGENRMPAAGANPQTQTSPKDRRVNIKALVPLLWPNVFQTLR